MQLTYRSTHSLTDGERSAVISLCTAAYEEDIAPYLRDIGDGIHLLGYEDAALVSHLMIVDRALQVDGAAILHAAYVELVATHPGVQGRGYASRLLLEIAGRLAHYDIAALSPSSEAFYARLGWESWRGPLSTRTAHGIELTPDESVMILRLPNTPAELNLDAPLSVEWRAGEVW